MLAVTGLTSTGCATFAGQPTNPYTQKVIDQYAVSFEKGKVEDCADLAKGLADATTPDQTKAAEARLCRDKIISDQLTVVNFAYNAFKASVNKTAGGLDAASDVLAAATSGASTVVTVTSTKNILSTLSTVITGTRTAFDKNLLVNQSVQVILARMDALRTTAMDPIRTGLAEDVVKYPLWQALRDVDTYIAAGSLSAALNDLQGSSNDKQNQAEEETQKTIRKRFRNAGSQRPPG